MIKVCCRCHSSYGEKNSSDSRKVTHGYCPACYHKAVVDVQEWLASLGSQKEEPVSEVRAA